MIRNKLLSILLLMGISCIAPACHDQSKDASASGTVIEPETDSFVGYWLNRPKQLEKGLLQERKVAMQEMANLRKWDVAYLVRQYFILSDSSIVDVYSSKTSDWEGSSISFARNRITHGYLHNHRYSHIIENFRGEWSYDEETQVLSSTVKIEQLTYNPKILALTDSFLILRGEECRSTVYPTCTSVVLVYKRFQLTAHSYKSPSLSESMKLAKMIIPDSNAKSMFCEKDPLVKYWYFRPNHLNHEMLKARTVTAKDIRHLALWGKASLVRFYSILKEDTIIDHFNPTPIGSSVSYIYFSPDSICQETSSPFAQSKTGGRWSYDEKSQMIHSEVWIGANTYTPKILALTDSFLVLQGEKYNGVKADGALRYPTCTSTVMIYKRLLQN